MPIALQSIQGLFPAPLLTYHVDGAEAFNRELLTEIERRHRDEAGRTRSNRLGWHSANDLFERKEAAHARIAATIREACDEAIAKLAPRIHMAALRASYEGWVNVNPTGAYNRPHDHPGFLLSGVYYVATPEPADQDQVSGRIEFINQRAALNDSLVAALFTAPSATIRPRPGMLLIFPANLLHWVHPNLAEDDRVTIAFNLKFEPRKKLPGSKTAAARHSARRARP